VVAILVASTTGATAAAGRYLSIAVAAKKADHIAQELWAGHNVLDGREPPTFQGRGPDLWFDARCVRISATQVWCSSKFGWIADAGADPPEHKHECMFRVAVTRQARGVRVRFRSTSC
jgi:hypothetical protein